MDLHQIAVYIATRADVETALRVVENLRERLSLLKTSPLMGRLGKEEGTREVILDTYVIPYRVRSNAVEILRIWHAQQLRRG